MKKIDKEIIEEVRHATNGYEMLLSNYNAELLRGRINQIISQTKNNE